MKIVKVGIKGLISKGNTLDNNYSASTNVVRGREVYLLVLIELHTIK